MAVTHGLAARLLLVTLALGCAAPQHGLGPDAGPQLADAAHATPTVPSIPPPPSVPVPCTALDGPGWVAQPNVGPRCGFERARCPAAVFEPSWEPCHGESLESCRRFVHPPRWDCVLPRASGWHDGTRGWMSLEFEHGGRSHAVIMAVDGPAVAAWRSDGDCQPSAWLRSGAVTLTMDGAQLFGDLATAHALTEPMPAPSFGASSYTWLADIAPGRQLWAERRIRLWQRSHDPAEAPLLLDEGVAYTEELHEPTFAGDRAVWIERERLEDGGRRDAIVIGGVETDRRELVVRTDASITRVVGDGRNLAWAQSTPTATGVAHQAWAARFDGAGLVDAHPLEVVSLGRARVIGDGLLAYTTGPYRSQHLVVVDLATGEAATHGSSFMRFAEPLYVTETELLVRVESAGWTSLYRLDPRELLGRSPE